MRRVCQVARAINGRQILNTLDIKSYWELVEIFVSDDELEPDARIGGEDFEEEDDWELVEIFVPE